MHTNIAQISRWWIAKSIISKKVDLLSLSPQLYPAPVGQDLSTLTRRAAPYNLASFEDSLVPSNSLPATLSKFPPSALSTNDMHTSVSVTPNGLKFDPLTKK
jgi:hypothetical protein